MGKKNRHSNTTKAEQEKNATTSVPAQSKPKAGLLVTDELEKALEKCRITVGSIARECRAKNRKFRDTEFDLDNDEPLCLYGLVPDDEHTPTGVARVSDIYQKPQFFIDGAGSNDIVQGRLGNCWFLSALSTISTADGLIEKFCVARDEQVGVYGFVFFKNGSWVTVIIDDLLYINVPKFEELSLAEQLLFHSDKVKYNKTARKGGKGLYFARSGTENETWVPIIEKAYAKLHGDYSSLSGGRAAEAIEDLTGGVSSMIRIKDILDTDKFWEDEMLKANADRLFGAAYDELDTERSGKSHIEVEGLVGGHAYSVLKAVEVNRKRFVVLRNPWGESEWKGPWSDGAREWTPEWLARLPEIGHLFGDDGQFVMEYSDFLEQFEDIDKTLLFDETWEMSMEWLRVPVRSPPCAWSFGDVSFNFSITEPTKAIIVLSKLDERYFKNLEGPHNYSLQFRVYKLGEEPEFVSESDQPVFASRSVNTETNLEPGNYAVHVRLDCLVRGLQSDPSTFDRRKYARVLTERSQARLIASNYNPLTEQSNFPTPVEELVGREKLIAEARARVTASPFTLLSAPPVGEQCNDRATMVGAEEEVINEGDGDDENWVDDDEEADNKKQKIKGVGKKAQKQDHEKRKDEIDALDENTSDSKAGSEADEDSDEEEDSEYIPSALGGGGAPVSPGFNFNGDSGELNVFIGLRVYTQGGGEVSIIGTLREEAEKLYASAQLGSVLEKIK